MTERDKRMSELTPELQQAFRMLDRAVEDVDKGDGQNLYLKYRESGAYEEFKRTPVYGQVGAGKETYLPTTKHKSVWRRIGKVALWWCALIGAMNMVGCLFYLLDMVLKRG